jgi:prepilin-type N-terminal cleavage/methylation domain-containing protein/prepilin-type processing-associated H-X9-DG protein
VRLKRGFTLIELLVVIAIISIVAAIVFPVYAAARGNARKAACVSNLRQIGMAARMYVQDYDGTLVPPMYIRTGPTPDYAKDFYSPRWTTWPELLQPYTANLDVFTCPERPDAFRKGYCLNSNSSGEIFPGSPTPPGNWSYHGPPGSADLPGVYSPTTAEITAESETIWFYDSTPSVLFITQLRPWQDTVNFARGRPNTTTLMNIDGSRLMARIVKDAGPHAETSTVIKDPWRHGGGMNIAWCDGHVSHKKPSMLKEENWNIEQTAQPDE